MVAPGSARTRLSTCRVVIAEPFSESGVAVLREHGIEVASYVGKQREELTRALGDADALIVRSETRVDRELLAAAGSRLAVVARAGVGVDEIDVAAATAAGIVVLNTPGANTLAATEQTFALMLSLLRHTPQAVASIRAGRWERAPFIGRELHGRTLGIVGLGRIGGAVAVRARAFGMHVIACDPFVSPARAHSLGIELLDLEAVLRAADVLTLHVPLSNQTRGMIDRGKLALLKPTSYVVNCARGGLVEELALLDALESGALAGAAIDVVSTEPPPPQSVSSALLLHPKVIATPHLGGSTHEALERIAVELARDVVTVLAGGPTVSAVNAPAADGPDVDRLRPFVDLAYRLGVVYPQIAAPQQRSALALTLGGEIAESPSEPLVAAFLAGHFQTTTDRRVSIVNALAIASELGVAVEINRTPESGAYTSTLRVEGEGSSLTGTVFSGSPRIVAIGEYEIDAIPSGSMLITQHRDVPGMVGKVGTILGEAQVNISTMQVSREGKGGDAVMILGIDRQLDPPTLAAIRSIAGIDDARSILV